MMKAIFAKGTAALAGAFTLLIILGSIAAYVVSVAGAELAGSTRLVITTAGWAIGTILVAVALGAAGVAMFTVLNHAERWLMKRSERRAVDKENDLTIVTAPANHQIHVSDARRIAAPFTPLHLPAPDPFQARAWLEWHQMISRPAARLEAPKFAGQLAAGEAMLELLPITDKAPNILLVGGKGSGKTTMLQHIVYRRAGLGQLLIFDSHDHPAKWPAGHVIGNGRNYQNIWKAAMALVNQLQKRYEAYSSGKTAEGQFEPVWNVIDEFTQLPKVFKKQGLDVQEYSLPLLTEGRKVGLNVIWGIHSDRAKYLGLEGAMDLKECFDAIIYLQNNVDTGERWAEIDFGQGRDKARRYRLPGPFTMNARPAQLGAGADLETDQAQPVWHVAPAAESAEVGPPQPTEEEQAIIFHYVDLRDNDRSSFSYNEVGRRAGIGTGGWQTQKIKDTLQKFGIEAI